jgi:hypothetical protein
VFGNNSNATVMGGTDQTVTVKGDNVNVPPSP